LVCSAIPVIASTMPPMRSERCDSDAIASETDAEDARTPRIAAPAASARAAPSAATARARSAAAAVCWALSALSRIAAPTRSVRSCAEATIAAWRSAPPATSSIARAISPTAVPASAEVDAIRSVDARTSPARSATRPSRSRSAPRVFS
jgi:hypothetical protein